MLEITHSGAAVLLLDRDSKHAKRAELAPQVRRELVRAIDFRSTGRNLRRGKIGHALAQHIGSLAEIEVQGLGLVAQHGRRSLSYSLAASGSGSKGLRTNKRQYRRLSR